MEQGSGQGRKTKRILIVFLIFLILMWILTLVSKSIYAARLPQVETEKPRRMSISHTVRVDGIVSEGRQFAVNVEEGMRVKTIDVRVGDTVEEGTLLFELDLEDLKDVILERETAIQELQLQIKDLETNRELAEAEKNREIGRANWDLSETDAEANEALEKAHENLTKAREELQQYRDNYPKVTPDAEREAEREAYEAWVSEGERLTAALEEASVAYESAARDKEAKEEALSSLLAGADSPEADTSAENAEDVDEEALPQDASTETPDATVTEESQNKDAENADTGAGAGPDASDAGPKASSTGPSPEEIEQARQELAQAEEALAQAKEALDQAQAALDGYMANAVAQPDFSGEDAAVNSWKSTEDSLKNAVSEAEYSILDEYQAKEDAEIEASRRLEDASLPDRADSTLEIQRLKLAGMQRKLQDYEEALDADGKICAKERGIVTAIRVSPGERTMDGAAITYADLSSPMQFSAILSATQKKYVNQFDPAKLFLGGATPESYQIDYIAESEGGSGTYRAVVNLPQGVGTIGQSGTMEVSAESEQYPYCVPAQALQAENNRPFVYIVGRKESILGEEMAAEKVFVDILDQNDKYAAIEGSSIDQDAEIILSSTEPIADRDVIRYRE